MATVKAKTCMAKELILARNRIDICICNAQQRRWFEVEKTEGTPVILGLRIE